MTWSTKIVIAFGCFITLIITMVVISMRQNINLVAKDYYVQEIEYQDQINRIKNHKSNEQLSLLHNKQDELVLLTYSNNDDITGEVLFFRPSDAAQDLKYKLLLSEKNQQVFETSAMSGGLWKVKVNWKQGNQEFYLEKTIVL